MLKNFVLATAIGTLWGVALVWWARPSTSPGSVFLIVLCVLATHVVAAIGGWIGGFFARSATSPKSAIRND